MNDTQCAETAPQPVIEGMHPEMQLVINTNRIRHDVGSIKIVLIIALIIGVACGVGSLLVQAKAESDLNSITQSNTQPLDTGFCVMNSC